MIAFSYHPRGRRAEAVRWRAASGRCQVSSAAAPISST